jgi:hypothetical protein
VLSIKKLALPIKIKIGRLGDTKADEEIRRRQEEEGDVGSETTCKIYIMEATRVTA